LALIFGWIQRVPVALWQCVDVHRTWTRCLFILTWQQEIPPFLKIVFPGCFLIFPLA
jgi:hypothetical protein